MTPFAFSALSNFYIDSAEKAKEQFVIAQLALVP